MKRILTGIVLMVLCCVGFAGSSMASDVDPSTCYHDWKGDYDHCEPYDAAEHTVTFTCERCGAKKTEQEIHTFPLNDMVYEYKDNEKHNEYAKCSICGYVRQMLPQYHSFLNEEEFTYKDENSHTVTTTCEKCGFKKVESKVHYLDDDEGDEIYKKFDKEKHTVCYKCMYCEGLVPYKKEKHEFDYDAKKIDGKYHNVIQTCSLCNEKVIVGKEKHEWEYSSVIRKATPTTKGIIKERCSDCDATREREVAFGSEYGSVKYEVSTFTPIYRTSKSVTVKLNRPMKGGTVQVKIGKKTYKAKIKNNSKKIKVKIKNPKMGQKVTVQLIYKNEVLYSGIGEDNDDDNWVYYAKKIKKGMTMKQVKYTYEWGPTDDTASSSGGWKFWHYDDYSSVSFKNGRVVSWYDAAG